MAEATHQAPAPAAGDGEQLKPGSRSLSHGQLQSCGAIGQQSLVWSELQCTDAAFNQLMQSLGVPSKAALSWTEIISCDDWFVSSLPGPILASIVAVPDASSTPSEAAALTRSSSGHNSPASATPATSPAPSTQAVDTMSEPWHMRQLVGNACGTIALLHCLLNLPHSVRSHVHAAPPLSRWLQQAEEGDACSAWQRGEWLEQDSAVAAAHAAASRLGSVSSASVTSEPSGHHFIAYLPAQVCRQRAAAQDHTTAMDRTEHCGCAMWELDGDLSAPVRHSCLCLEGGAGGAILQACVSLASARQLTADAESNTDHVAMLALCHEQNKP